MLFNYGNALFQQKISAVHKNKYNNNDLGQFG